MDRPRERIRPVIVCYSTFIALMLLQTSYMQIGTIGAFVSIILTLGAYIFSGNVSLSRIIVSKDTLYMLVFFFFVSFTTLINGSIPSNFVRLAAQIILFIVVSTLTLNKKEHDFLRWIFSIAGTVYAIIAIRSAVINEATRYFHGDIEIFGTKFDPNYIAIAFVATSGLMLDNLLRRKSIIISASMYAINLVAIVYTASRGAMLSFLVSNAFIIYFTLIKGSRMSIKKIFIFVIIALVGVLAYFYFSTRFATQFNRMSDISTETNSGRFDLWQAAIQAWLNSPIFGNGFGYMIRYNGAATHNTFFQLLSETGIVGVIMFGIIMFRQFKRSFRYDKSCFSILVGMTTQIMFLDALDNRCLWALMCWIVMIPLKPKQSTYKTIRSVQTRVWN